MARRSGGRSVRAPARAPARNPPAPVKAAPPPAPAQSGSGGSVIGTIGSAIGEGLGFGAGHAVGNRVVDTVMGPRTFRHENVVAAAPESTVASSSLSDACGMHFKAFQDCINSSGNDISKCQFYIDMLSECRKTSGLAA